MEIERKFLVERIPENLERFPVQIIEQGYLCTEPVIRIRRLNDDYILTYKSKGLMVREEVELPLTADSYQHLSEKTDGIMIQKKRYLIQLDETLTAELDIFSGHYEGLVLVEVEFSSEAEAEQFTAPEWFGEDVTFSGEYQNSKLSQEATE